MKYIIYLRVSTDQQVSSGLGLEAQRQICLKLVPNGSQVYVKIYGFKKLGKEKRKYKQIVVNGKKIREHRWIMQNHLGRKLESSEHVHHIDGDCLNNNLSNLIVLSSSDHQKLEHHEHKKFISSS